MALGYVRPARTDEAADVAAAIARIQVETWRVAYRTLLPRTILDGLDVAWMADRWRAAINSPPSPRHHVLIAIEQASAASEPTATNQLVGFAAIGPADDEARAPGEAELPETVAAITDMLVEPRWGRRGHGSRLLAAAADLWREAGFQTAIAWAYEQDQATRKFLTSAGWAADGATRSLDVDDLLVPQLRLHTALDVAATEATGAAEAR